MNIKINLTFMNSTFRPNLVDIRDAHQNENIDANLDFEYSGEISMSSMYSIKTSILF